LEKRIESSQKEADYTLKEIAKLEPLSSKVKKKKKKKKKKKI